MKPLWVLNAAAIKRQATFLANSYGRFFCAQNLLRKQNKYGASPRQGDENERKNYGDKQ